MHKHDDDTHLQMPLYYFVDLQVAVTYQAWNQQKAKSGTLLASKHSLNCCAGVCSYIAAFSMALIFYNTLIIYSHLYNKDNNE